MWAERILQINKFKPLQNSSILDRVKNSLPLTVNIQNNWNFNCSKIHENGYNAANYDEFATSRQIKDAADVLLNL